MFIQPTCHVNHLPPYIEKYDQFKAKGVDVIAVVAANDAFVMSGWGRFEGLKDKVSFQNFLCFFGSMLHTRVQPRIRLPLSHPAALVANRLL